MTSARSPWRGRLIALAGIALLAFSLRTAVASLSPLLDLIGAEFPIPTVVVGLIGTAPPACFAIGGIITPLLTARLGIERTSVISLVLIAVGLFGRAFAADALGLLALTAVIFAGVGIGNVLLPPLVKKYFPDRMSAVMTIYTTMLIVASFLPPLVAVPVAQAYDWRVSLGWWGLFTVVALLPWVMMSVRDRAPHSGGTPAAPQPQYFARMLRSPLAWSILVVFSSSSVFAYVSFGWLPVIVAEQTGADNATAGFLLAVNVAMGLPATLLVPLLVVRYRATRVLLVVGATCVAVGLAGLAFVPTVAVALWAALFGSQGIMFTMGLVLIGIRVRDHESAVTLSGFVQSIGYAVAALFPFLVGVMREASGGWVVPLSVLMVVAIAIIPFGLYAGRETTVEEEWERRHGRAW